MVRCNVDYEIRLEKKQALAAKWGVGINELTGSDAPFGYLYSLAQTSRSRATWLQMAEGANVRIECEWAAPDSKPEDVVTEDILLFFSDDPNQAVKVAVYFSAAGTLNTGPFLLRRLDAVESSCPRSKMQG
jgi:hypothetical protein